MTLPDGTTDSASGLSLGTAVVLPSGSTATTQLSGDNSSKVATTAFVKNQLGIQAIPACTIYASPSGGGSGSSYSTPTTISSANSAATAGSVICLEGGTYNLASTFYPTSGTSGAHITWEAYGDSPVNFVWTGGAAGTHTMFNFYDATPPNCTSLPCTYDAASSAYIDFIGRGMWSWDGAGYATSASFITSGHHISISGMYVKNMAATGVACKYCDYISFHDNVSYHNGYNPNSVGYQTGWGSAYSINDNAPFDSYSGIHNFIYNNIAAGTYDSSTYHTDGNGIILDMVDTSTVWAPTLIMNNIVYGNGGRCIESNAANQNNTLIFNNTCYLNGLDSSNSFDEFYIRSNSTYVANNISIGLGADGCSTHSATCEYDFDLVSSPTGLVSSQNVYFGGFGNNNYTAGVIHGNPPFVNPLTLAFGGYSTTPDPGVGGVLLGNQLQPSSGGALVAVGIDPTVLPGLNSNIVSDLKTLVYRDIDGNPRAVGSWDLGAMQATQLGSGMVVQQNLSVSGTTVLGTATAATPSTGDNSANIATTAFVRNQGYVPNTTIVNGHALSGNVTVAPADLAAGALANGMTATTQSAGDYSTKLATTGYVRNEMQLAWTCPVAGSTAVSQYCNWTLPAGLTVTGFDFASSTAPVGCTTYPTMQLWDGTTGAEVGSYSITLSSGANFYAKVAGSTNVPMGDQLRVKVTTAAAGCSPYPAAMVATVTYQMQN